MSKGFGKDTKILMYDGTVKEIKNIVVGDKIMGDDGMPRNVLDIKETSGELYKLNIKKSPDLFIGLDTKICIIRDSVNKRKKTRKWAKEEIVLKDYLKMSKNYKNRAKVYQKGLVYKEQELLIDAYYLGIWLGDGVSSEINRFCSADEEIVLWCEKYAISMGLMLKQHSRKKGKCQTYCLSSGITCGVYNSVEIVKNGRFYDLINNKHIPLEYLTSSEKQRLELLAGLIDTDGYVHGGFVEITQKNEILADDIVKLCCSLGMNAQKKYVYKKSQNMPKDYKGNRYCKISISGDLTKIPIKLKRKQILEQNTRVNPCHHGFDVGFNKIDDMIELRIDGNQKFLLENHLLVSAN